MSFSPGLPSAVSPGLSSGERSTAATAPRDRESETMERFSPSEAQIQARGLCVSDIENLISPTEPKCVLPAAAIGAESRR
jgi:hypothetical protein